MADLSKSGIATAEDILATHVTKLYDALTGDIVYDNVYSNKGKIYRALITQTETSAPTVTVLENTLGGDVVWTRSGVGMYYGTLADAFPSAKTIVTTQGITKSPSVEDDSGFNIRRNDNDRLSITSWEGGIWADGILVSESVEVIVYPA